MISNTEISLQVSGNRSQYSSNSNSKHLVTRMDVLMCFQADILLEIPRVHVSRQVQVSRPHLGGGWFQVLVWTQLSTALGDFVTLLRLIRGCALGPLEA